MKNTLLLTSTFALVLSSCSTVSKSPVALKANAVPLSSFIEHPRQMKPQRERAPFALSWTASNLPAKRARYDSIYVAPVTTSYLRAAKTTLTEKTTGIETKQRPVREFANLMRQSFAAAFSHSPSPRVKLVSAPRAGSVTLKLALIELNPTDAAGNVVKTAAPYGGVLSPFTGGSIAIEGKVCDSTTGEVLFEFADVEKDKMSVVSVRDFSPYEHAKVAIAEWAKQFEELTRTPPGHKVQDSLFFTLNPL